MADRPREPAERRDLHPTDYGKLHTLIEGDFYGTGSLGGNEQTNTAQLPLPLRLCGSRQLHARSGAFDLPGCPNAGGNARFRWPRRAQRRASPGLAPLSPEIGDSEVAVAIENPEGEFLGGGGSSAVHENYTLGEASAGQLHRQGSRRRRQVFLWRDLGPGNRGRRPALPDDRQQRHHRRPQRRRQPDGVRRC